jgi:hypothetical protein
MLSRFIAVTAFSVATVLGVHLYRTWSAPAPTGRDITAVGEDLSVMDEVNRERAQQLHDTWRRWLAFNQLTVKLTAELARGETGLHDATNRLFYYCLQNYPEHLECVMYAERGRSIKMSIAHNLVRPFRAPRVPEYEGPGMAEAAARLEQELLELACLEEPDPAREFR